MLEGMYSRNNKRLLALLMFQSMRRDNLRGVFGVPRGDCEFLILRGASLSSSLGQSRRAQWWAPSPPPHARSSLERRHGGSRTHTKRRIPTGLLPGKRGALQVLLAWKLMCVCPPQKIWGWGEHRSWCSHDLKTTTDGEANLEAKLIHHTMRSRFHGPIDACRGPCLLAATIQLLNGTLRSTTADRDLHQFTS